MSESWDIDQIEMKTRAVKAILEKPVWDTRDVSIYIGRSEWYVRRLFMKGLIRRDVQGLTRRDWVHEYLDQPVTGRVKSPLKKEKE